MSVDPLTMTGTTRKWENALKDADTIEAAQKIVEDGGGSFQADENRCTITDENGAEVAFALQDGRFRSIVSLGAEELPPLSGASEQDFGIAFANRYRDRILHEKSARVWYICEGGLWTEDRLHVVARHMQTEIIRAKAAIHLANRDDRDLTKQMGRMAFQNGCLAAASLVEGISVDILMFDADPWVLGVPGGYIDLKNGNVCPPDPRKLLTKPTSVMPTKAADCPKWKKFLSEAHAGQTDVIEWLQVFSGLCLTGTMRDEIVVFFHGDGGNGKTVFTHTISKILGGYGVMAQESAFTTTKQGHRGHAQDIAVLKGARLIICAEPDEGRMWDMGRVKAWSGNEGKIVANLMRQNGFEFDPQGKLVLVANHKLDIRTVDAAVHRRLRMVSWPNAPTIVDKTLKETLLKEEGPAILAWMIEGLLKYLKSGLPTCQAIDDATAEYLREKDVMGRFVEDCFEQVEVTTPIPLTDVTALFKMWSHADGEPAKSYIGKDLTGKGLIVARSKNGKVIRNAILTEAGCEMMTRVFRERLERKADKESHTMPRPDWWTGSSWPFETEEERPQ